MKKRIVVVMICLLAGFTKVAAQKISLFQDNKSRNVSMILYRNYTVTLKAE